MPELTIIITSVLSLTSYNKSLILVVYSSLLFLIFLLIEVSSNVLSSKSFTNLIVLESKSLTLFILESLETTILYIFVSYLAFKFWSKNFNVSFILIFANYNTTDKVKNNISHIISIQTLVFLFNMNIINNNIKKTITPINI